MRRDLRLDEYSPRATEPLPPHVPLDAAAIERLWWDTSPQAMALRELFAEMTPAERVRAIAYLEGQARKGRGR